MDVDEPEDVALEADVEDVDEAPVPAPPVPKPSFELPQPAVLAVVQSAEPRIRTGSQDG